jgi:hypothetical protein
MLELLFFNRGNSFAPKINQEESYPINLYKNQAKMEQTKHAEPLKKQENTTPTKTTHQTLPRTQ